MKNSTMYLFDRPKSAYQPHVTILASRRIADGKILMKKLAKEKNLLLKQSEIDVLIERYQATADAVKHWEKILGEE